MHTFQNNKISNPSIDNRYNCLHSITIVRYLKKDCCIRLQIQFDVTHYRLRRLHLCVSMQRRLWNLVRLLVTIGDFKSVAVCSNLPRWHPWQTVNAIGFHSLALLRTGSVELLYVRKLPNWLEQCRKRLFLYVTANKHSQISNINNDNSST